MWFSNIVERFGGSCRCATLLTIIIHFLHPLFCFVTYCYWVREEEELLGKPIVAAYLAMMIVAILFYLFLASVFYVWAWRFPEPEEVAKRRRIYGTTINLLFSDLPLFVIETKIVWQVQFANAVQGFTFCLTCASIFYSVVRVWTFFMVKVIKVRAPVATAYPRFSVARPYDPRGGAPPAMDSLGGGQFGNSGVYYDTDGVGSGGGGGGILHGGSGSGGWETHVNHGDSNANYFGPSATRRGQQYYDGAADDLHLGGDYSPREMTDNRDVVGDHVWR